MAIQDGINEINTYLDTLETADDADSVKEFADRLFTWINERTARICEKAATGKLLPQSQIDEFKSALDSFLVE